MAYRDRKRWFSTSPNALSNHWMQQILWRGCFHCDNQVVMGSVQSSAREVGTRLSGTATLIIKFLFDYEWTAIVKLLLPDLLSIMKG